MRCASAETTKLEPENPASKTAAMCASGRPTKLSPAIAREILDGLAKGTPLPILCEPESMPDADTVRNWAAVDPEFSRDMAGACETGYNRNAMDAQASTETPVEEQTITDPPDGREIKWNDIAERRRLQVETRLKRLATELSERDKLMFTQQYIAPNGEIVNIPAGYVVTPEDEVVILRIAESRARTRMSREAEEKTAHDSTPITRVEDAEANPLLQGEDPAYDSTDLTDFQHFRVNNVRF